MVYLIVAVKVGSVGEGHGEAGVVGGGGEVVEVGGGAVGLGGEGY